jgi:hypothetical protein
MGRLLLAAGLGIALSVSAPSSPQDEPSDAQREAKLETVIGKTLYACSGADLNEFELSGADIKFGKRIVVYPLLTPFRVEKATVTSAGAYGLKPVALILGLPDGKRAVTGGFLHLSGPLKEGLALLDDLLGSERTTLMLEIPNWWTREHVETIRDYRATMPGMSESEVICVRGLPEKINHWGRGGDQLIYFGGKLIFYFDENGKYEDMQELDVGD